MTPQSKFGLRVIHSSAANIYLHVKPGSVDLALFGPPYWKEYCYDDSAKQRGSIKKYSEYLDAMGRDFYGIAKTLKPGGVFAFWAHDQVIISRSMIQKYVPLHYDLASKLPKSIELRGIVVWDRYLVRQIPFPTEDSVQGTKVQYIVFGVKKGHIPTAKITESIDNFFWKPVWKFKTTPTLLGSKLLFKTTFNFKQIIPVVKNYRTTKIPVLKDPHIFDSYPTKCPAEVAQLVINKFSERGDLILDPYCGSGTTLREAIKLHRRAIGSDINPDAIALSSKI